MNTAQVQAISPAAPACFTRATWVQLLTAWQASKNKPFKDGVFRPEFNFCSDCTLEQAVRMDRAGKCSPSLYRSPVKEVAHVETV